MGLGPLPWSSKLLCPLVGLRSLRKGENTGIWGVIWGYSRKVRLLILISGPRNLSWIHACLCIPGWGLLRGRLEQSFDVLTSESALLIDRILDPRLFCGFYTAGVSAMAVGADYATHIATNRKHDNGNLDGSVSVLKRRFPIMYSGARFAAACFSPLPLKVTFPIRFRSLAGVLQNLPVSRGTKDATTGFKILTRPSVALKTKSPNWRALVPN